MRLELRAGRSMGGRRFFDQPVVTDGPVGRQRGRRVELIVELARSEVMVRMLRILSVIVAAGLAFAPAAPIALAQTDEIEAAPLDPAPVEEPALKPAKKKAKAAKVEPATPAAGDVGQRIDQIEDELVDMKVVVGTLESLARTRPAATGDGGATFGGDSDQRLATLENQIQALMNQIERLSTQMQEIETRSGGKPLRQGAAATDPAAAAAAAGTGVEASGFGDVTVSRGAAATTIDDVLDAPATAAEAEAGGAFAATQAPIAAEGGETSESAYEEAYGHLLQQDYGAAELAFRDFLARYPDSKLAGNAHFWLGQSFYVRGEYKPAADAFLEGYKSYRKGQKAPDSLLKLAMSLSRLGQKDAACSAFVALDGEYPNAPDQVKRRAKSERTNTGCP